MLNIRVIDQNVDVVDMVTELNANNDAWQEATNMMVSGEFSVSPSRPPLSYIPLVRSGNTTSAADGVRPGWCDNMELVKTSFYYLFPNMTKWMVDRFGVNLARIWLFRLFHRGDVFVHHIDHGNYYAAHDRYHLCIKGMYEYCVGDEVIVVKPGFFFWFNNQKVHGSKNLLDSERVTLVFDARKESVCLAG